MVLFIYDLHALPHVLLRMELLLLRRVTYLTLNGTGLGPMTAFILAVIRIHSRGSYTVLKAFLLFYVPFYFDQLTE